jgi:hypothetical protein
VPPLRAEPKPVWRLVPAAVRARAEHLLGARVIRAVRLWGGYAPSPMFRLFLASGRRVVLKGVGPTGFENNIMRRNLGFEERAYTELRSWLSRWAPTLYGAYREGDWHILLLEDLGPQRIPPWTPDAIAHALREYSEFHNHSPGQPLPDWLQPLHAHFGRGWREVAAEPVGLDSLAAIAGERRAEARAWLAQHAAQLQDVSERLASVPPPYALLHFDTRSDNLRLQDGVRLRLFDWPLASIGPPELDAAAFAQSITVEGGPRPEAVMQHYTGLHRDDVMDAAVAAMPGTLRTERGGPQSQACPAFAHFSARSWASRSRGALGGFTCRLPNGCQAHDARLRRLIVYP